MYQRNFYAVIGTTQKTFLRVVKTGLSLTLDSSEADGKFYVIKRHGTEVGLIWSSDKGIHLMHECLHATFWSLRKAGTILSYESEEAFTYHQSMLMRAFTRP